MTNNKSIAATPDSFPTIHLTRIVMILVALVFSGLASLAQSNNVTQFDHLKQPKISTRKNQKMVVVEAKGDPNVIGG